MIGKTIFPELESIELEKNYLVLANKYSKSDCSNNKTAISNIININNYIKKNYKNINFVYIQYPNKISKYKDNLPPGIIDDRNKTSDEIIEKLKINKVDYFDLRESIIKQNLNHHELFLKTDHHWKSETGLWASKEICKYFETTYNISFNYYFLSKDNYSIKIIKKRLLGSIGRKLTLGYTDPEDLTILYPNFQTNLTFDNLKKTMQGNFKEIFINEKASQMINIDYYKEANYNFYKSSGFYIVHNNLPNNNITCLFLVDSYHEVVTPFLSLMFKKIIIVSPRVFSGSIKSCIDYFKPNIVCIAQTSRLIPQDKSDFNWNLFQFE